MVPLTLHPSENVPAALHEKKIKKERKTEKIISGCYLKFRNPIEGGSRRISRASLAG